MTSKRLGRQTVRLAQPPSVVSYANIGEIGRAHV